MRENQLLTVVGLAAAGSISVVVAEGSFDPWDSLIGLLMILVLWSVFESARLAQFRERLLVAAVFSLSLYLVVAGVLRPLVAPAPSESVTALWVGPGTCVAITVLTLLVMQIARRRRQKSPSQ